MWSPLLKLVGRPDDDDDTAPPPVAPPLTVIWSGGTSAGIANPIGGAAAPIMRSSARGRVLLVATSVAPPAKTIYGPWVQAT